MKLGFKKINKNLNTDDMIKFYCLKNKLSQYSHITGVISKSYKQMINYLKFKYNKSYSIIASPLKKCIIVAKDDFVEEYIILDNLDDLNKCKFKFSRYI